MSKITLPKDWITYGSRFLISSQLPKDTLPFFAFYSSLPKIRSNISDHEFEKVFGCYMSGDRPIDNRSHLWLSLASDRFGALSSRTKQSVISLAEDTETPSKVPSLTAYFVKIHIGPGFFEFLESLDKENKQ